MNVQREPSSMGAQREPNSAEQTLASTRPESLWADAWKRMRRNRAAVLAAALLAVVAVVTVLAPWLPGLADPPPGVGFAIAGGATQAGSVPRVFGLGRGEVESHLGAAWPPGRAGRAAVDAGRGHRVDEAAVGLDVPGLHGVPAKVVVQGQGRDHGLW